MEIHSSRSSNFLVATVLSLIVIAHGIAWLRIDQSVWPFDPAWYGEVSLKLYSSLRDTPLSEWWHSMIHAFGFKTPLIAWIGQFLAPLHTFLGGYENALAVLPLLSSAAAVMVLMITASRLFNESTRAVLTTGLTMTGSSLFVGMSHEYFVESLQLLSVALIYYLVTSRLNGVPLLLISLCTIALGMLSKISTPLYILVPGILILYDISKRIRQLSSIRTTGFLGIFTVALLALSGSWFFTNWNELITFLHATSGGEVAELYGKKGEVVTKLLFWIEMLGISFFNCKPGAWLWLALGSVAIFARIRRQEKFDRRELVLLCSILQILLVLYVFSTQYNEETRYLLPLLPSVALISAYIGEQLKKIWVPLFLYLFVQSSLVMIASLTGDLPSLSLSPWLKHPNADDTQKRILHRVISTTCNERVNGRYTIIGHEIGLFNANSASFYMAQQRALVPNHPLCYYTSLGYAEKDDARSWKRIHDLKSAYVVFREDLRSSPDDPFNAVSESIRSRVMTSDEFFRIDEPEFSILQIYQAQGEKTPGKEF